MFNAENLAKIDRNYFNILVINDMDISVQSKNTGHYWYLHCAGYPTEEALVIFHKHKFQDGYHQHGRANTLRQAVRNIQKHDEFQLNGRKYA